jgi:hypothetical protein
MKRCFGKSHRSQAPMVFSQSGPCERQKMTNLDLTFYSKWNLDPERVTRYLHLIEGLIHKTAICLDAKESSSNSRESALGVAVLQRGSAHPKSSEGPRGFHHSKHLHSV